MIAQLPRTGRTVVGVHIGKFQRGGLRLGMAVHVTKDVFNFVYETMTVGGHIYEWPLSRISTNDNGVYEGELRGN